MRELDDKKRMNATLALIRDIYRLTKKGKGKGKVKVFENLKSEHFNTLHIINNGILSLMDLGFLYSIISLAHSDRQTLKKDIKWSSKIEIAYIQSDYRKLFNDLNKEYDNYGKFNPTVRFVFDDCLRHITKRVLQEVLSAYQMVSLAKVEQLTGIRTSKVEQFLKDNLNLPYLFDPITQSAVYYVKNVPLYQQAQTFYEIIKEKYDEKARALIQDTREDFEDMEFDMDDDDDRGRGRGPARRMMGMGMGPSHHGRMNPGKRGFM